MFLILDCQSPFSIKNSIGNPKTCLHVYEITSFMLKAGTEIGKNRQTPSQPLKLFFFFILRIFLNTS